MILVEVLAFLVVLPILWVYAPYWGSRSLRGGAMRVYFCTDEPTLATPDETVETPVCTPLTAFENCWERKVPTFPAPSST